MTGTEPHAQETGLMDTITYVGLDVVRQLGVFENRPEVLTKLTARLSKGGRRLSFCYEAGLCATGCTDC
jgi:hypothetical protein